MPPRSRRPLPVAGSGAGCVVALFDSTTNQPFQKGIAHARRYSKTERMSDEAPVGTTGESLLPCRIATHVPIEAQANPGKAWGSMVSNRSIRARLVSACAALLVGRYTPPPGRVAILDDPEDPAGVTMISSTPRGRVLRTLGPVAREFGEADVKTLVWLEWARSAPGRSVIAVGGGRRPRVLLTSIDSDMTVIAAMHVLITPWAPTKPLPCRVMLIPGAGKRKRATTFVDADGFCSAMAAGGGDGAATLAAALNRMWAIVVSGCDFVRGFPRFDVALAIRAAARVAPIEVTVTPPGIFPRTITVRLVLDRAARVIAACFPKLQGVSSSSTPETVLRAMRAKYKVCAATPRDAETAGGMLRAAFWVLCGYWLPAAQGRLHSAADRGDAAEASRWGFKIDPNGKVFHAEADGAVGASLETTLVVG